MKLRQAKKIYNNLLKGRKYSNQQAKIACKKAYEHFAKVYCTWPFKNNNWYDKWSDL